jgi:hypothetical protein
MITLSCSQTAAAHPAAELLGIQNNKSPISYHAPQRFVIFSAEEYLED